VVSVNTWVPEYSIRSARGDHTGSKNCPVAIRTGEPPSAGTLNKTRSSAVAAGDDNPFAVGGPRSRTAQIDFVRKRTESGSIRPHNVHQLSSVSPECKGNLPPSVRNSHG